MCSQKFFKIRCFPVKFAKFLRTPLDDCFWMKIPLRLHCTSFSRSTRLEVSSKKVCLKIYQNSQENTFAGIYPISFTNVRFLTKIEFSNVLFQKKKKKNNHEVIVKYRWGSECGVSSAAGSWRSPGGVSGGEAPENI